VSLINLAVGNHPEELKQFLSTFLELSFKPKPVEQPQHNPESYKKPAESKKKGICGVQ
jgi:hypothetical protein